MQLIAGVLLFLIGSCGITSFISDDKSTQKSDTTVSTTVTTQESDNQVVIKNVQSNQLNEMTATEVVSYADIISQASESERPNMVHKAIKCYVPNFDSVEADNSSASKALVLLASGLPELTDQGNRGNQRYFDAKNLVREEPESARYIYRTSYHEKFCSDMPSDNQ